MGVGSKILLRCYLSLVSCTYNFLCYIYNLIIVEPLIIINRHTLKLLNEKAHREMFKRAKHSASKQWKMNKSLAEVNNVENIESKFEIMVIVNLRKSVSRTCDSTFNAT